MKKVEISSDQREAALEKAMRLFWDRGAEVASYGEIVAATGLSRKSLYALWPDKDALVHDTVERYRKHLTMFVIRPLKAGGKTGLAQFWDGFEQATFRENWRGCYLFRTASGPLRDQSFVVEAFDKYIDDLTKAYEENVRAAQQAGEISSDIDAKAASLQAASLLGLISLFGAQSGCNDRVLALVNAGRASCGLTA